MKGVGVKIPTVRGAQEITLSSKSYNSSPIIYPSLRSVNGREIIRLRTHLTDSRNETTDDCVKHSEVSKKQSQFRPLY